MSYINSILGNEELLPWMEQPRRSHLLLSSMTGPLSWDGFTRFLVVTGSQLLLHEVSGPFPAQAISVCHLCGHYATWRAKTRVPRTLELREKGSQQALEPGSEVCLQSCACRRMAACAKSSSFYTSSSILVLFPVFFFPFESSHVNGHEVVFVVLIYISLMIDDAEHLFMFLLAICVSSLEMSTQVF